MGRWLRREIEKTRDTFVKFAKEAGLPDFELRANVRAFIKRYNAILPVSAQKEARLDAIRALYEVSDKMTVSRDMPFALPALSESVDGRKATPVICLRDTRGEPVEIYVYIVSGSGEKRRESLKPVFLDGPIYTLEDGVDSLVRQAGAASWYGWFQRASKDPAWRTESNFGMHFLWRSTSK
jgi:hypothetical protein